MILIKKKKKMNKLADNLIKNNVMVACISQQKMDTNK